VYDEVEGSCSVSLLADATPQAAYRVYSDGLRHAGWRVQHGHAPRWTAQRKDLPNPPAGSVPRPAGDILRAERNGLAIWIDGSDPKEPRVFVEAHIGHTG
jgi:hypothetical protein